MMTEALFYEKTAGNQVRCGLCRHCCTIPDGRRGICNARENRGGVLYSLVYGKIIAENIDPVEKKPLFHFMPGSRTYSIATPGCNFHCLQCQNYNISQIGRDSGIQGVNRTPEEIVESALQSGCSSISYTYTEPAIFYEFALDSAILAKEAGLKNIFVTNGYICKEPLARIAPFLDAANIDLKGFDERKYTEIFGGKLSGVLDSIIEHRKQKIWLELTTLIIPGINDSDAELNSIASFIMQNLGADTPWHVSQFYPTYRLVDRPPTPLSTLRRARDIGMAAGLLYVYEGNVPGEGGENTCCPSCDKVLIERYGYRISANSLKEGKCPECGTELAGIGLQQPYDKGGQR
jgi:pyruvate formate lyase activating enzyme